MTVLHTRDHHLTHCSPPIYSLSQPEFLQSHHDKKEPQKPLDFKTLEIKLKEISANRVPSTGIDSKWESQVSNDESFQSGQSEVLDVNENGHFEKVGLLIFN